MRIKLSLAFCDGTVEADPQTLLTLEIDSQPSIETLGLSLANCKVALAQLQAQIVTRQVELMSASAGASPVALRAPCDASGSDKLFTACIAALG